MRKAFKFALAAVLVTVVVPAAAYRLMTPADEDPMSETLRDFGFVRVRLPSNLMNVGSLYYVDSGLKDFKTTCHAHAAELGQDVIASRSWDIEKTLQRKGELDTAVSIDFGSVVNGTYDNDYTHTVRFSLTQITVEELPLDRSSLIYTKLMTDPACNSVALQFVDDAPRHLLKIRQSCAHLAWIDLCVGYGRGAKEIVQHRDALIRTGAKVDAV